MAGDAVELARAIGYRGAGTVEFLVDRSSKGDYSTETAVSHR